MREILIAVTSLVHAFVRLLASLASYLVRCLKCWFIRKEERESAKDFCFAYFFARVYLVATIIILIIRNGFGV